MSDIRWQLAPYKIDIEGSDGNVFVLLAKMKGAIIQLYGYDAAEEFCTLAMGSGIDQIGIEWTYNDVLEKAIELTGIEFTSSRELPTNSDLYTIRTQPNEYL